MATRYHLVYPALAYYALLQEQPGLADELRPKLDTMYRSLLDPRCWTYWHTYQRAYGNKVWLRRIVA